MPHVDTEQRFAIVPEWVIVHDDLTGNDIRVYCALWRHANGDNRCHPSYKRLADMCNLSRSTIKRCIERLCDARAVTKRRRPNRPDGTPRSNVYRVMTTPPEGSTGEPGGVTTDPGGGVTTDPGVGSPVTSRTKAIEREQPLPPDGGDPPVTHQQVVDRLVTVCGLTLPLTKSEAGRVAKAAKGIRPVLDGLDDIDRRARAYRDRWPDIDLTPTGLESNWSQVASAVDARAGPTFCGVCGVDVRQHDDRWCAGAGERQ